MLGHKKIPSRDGGIEVVVEKLSRRLIQRGVKVTCLNRQTHGEAMHFKSKCYEGIYVKVLPTLNFKRIAAVSSSITGAIVAALGKYDVIHFHAEGPSFMCWLPKLFGKKIIVTIHGLDHKRAKWGWFASWYIRKGERNAVKYADDVIVLSRDMQQYFKDKYNRDTVYIPNGVDKPALENIDAVKNKFNLKKDNFILYLGRLVPEKGIHYLIKAYKDIQTDKELVIAGGTSDTDNYVEYIKELAQDDKRIKFTGFVDGTILASLYSNAYCYVLPSDVEGMPLSLLEAMSYGNCCLTSNIPECAEVVADNGVTFQKGSIKDLQNKLRYLIDNPKDVDEYKQNASGYILKKYNWEDVADKTIYLYKK